MAYSISTRSSTAGLFESGSQHRALWICIAASIVIHSAVLWLVPGARQSSPASTVRVLTAHLGPSAQAPTPSQRAEPPAVERPEKVPPKPETKRAVEPPKPVLTRPTPEPSAPRVAAEPPAPAPAPQAAPQPSAPSVATAPPSTAPRAPEAQSPPPSSGPAQATAKVGDASDAGTVDQYRLALMSAARKFKRYPSQAMEKGWTGKVEVRMVVGANGLIQNVVIKSGSGYEILDNQALKMVKDAKPWTVIPPGLKGREFTVDIPVVFDLQSG